MGGAGEVAVFVVAVGGDECLGAVEAGFADEAVAAVVFELAFIGGVDDFAGLVEVAAACFALVGVLNLGDVVVAISDLDQTPDCIVVVGVDFAVGVGGLGDLAVGQVFKLGGFAAAVGDVGEAVGAVVAVGAQSASSADSTAHPTVPVSESQLPTLHALQPPTYR